MPRPLTMFVWLLLAAAIWLGLPYQSSSQESPATDGQIRLIINGDTSGSPNGSVLLYRDGKLVAMKDTYVGLSVEFTKLAPGTYELRTDFPGRRNVIKKSLLTEQDKSVELICKVEKGEGTIVMGGGPSLHELESRIAKLEAAVAKLQGK